MTTRPLRRILVVDDDPDIREVTTLLLAAIAGFEVRACRSAVEAFEVAAAFDPDLILLDVMMPSVDGQTALTAFRQISATATTPIVFMTARVDPGEITQYRQLGSLGVIPKPFDPATLAETIVEMWNRDQAESLDAARREQLAELGRLYAAELPQRIRAIEDAAASLRRSDGDDAVAASLYEMSHRLAGSAAIYGFSAVSECAGRIAGCAKEHPAGRTGAPSPSLLRLVDALKEALVTDERSGRTAGRHS